MAESARTAPFSLASVLSFAAGYADAAGFLALHGLFTAHVTGNFVTLGASLVQGTEGGVTKLMALPMFCAVVFAVRLLRYRFVKHGYPVLRAMLLIECTLLVVAAVLAWMVGPFADGDGAPAFTEGMILVAAMAIQNAVQRVHLAHMPPTTVMTGTTTQIMIDAADLLHGVPAEQAAAARKRVKRMLKGVIAFGSGCAAAALAYYYVEARCFAVLPPLALAILLHPEVRASAGQT